MVELTFKKAERLKSRKLIGNLFKNGQSLSAFPLKLIWRELSPEETNTDYPIQISVSVPKRAFPKAVHRNQVRRKIRESWRLNKSWLYKKIEEENNRYAFMVIYIGREPMPYENINMAVRKMNRKFLWKINNPKK